MSASRVSFHLRIDGAHAALVDDPEEAVGAILEDVAAKVKSAGHVEAVLTDGNGNRVGEWFLLIEGDDGEEGAA